MLPFSGLLFFLLLLGTQIGNVFLAQGVKRVYSQETVDEDANKMFEEFWADKLRMDPEFATSVGVHTYNDKLESKGPKDFWKKFVMLVEYSSRAYELLQYADEGTLTKSNLEVFISQNVFQTKLLRIGSQFLPVSYLEGPHLNLMYLLDLHPLKTTKDYRDLISRYNAFSQQVEEVIELMNTGIRFGLTQHERSLKNVEQTLSSLDKPAEKSPFFDPFKSIVDTVPQSEIQDIQNSAKEAINQSISPALRKLKEYITNVYRKYTRSDIGVNSVPSGKEFYKTILDFYSSESVEAEDIHQLGVKEVERIGLEMKKVIESLGLNHTLREFNENIRNDPQFFFDSSDEALETYRDVILNKIQPKLPKIFKKIPKAQIQIKKVPDHMVGGPNAYYMPGSPDGTSQGTFYVDTSSLNDLPKYDVITLSLHEGLPGHHFQISYIMEQKGVPEFRKHVQYPVNAAYLEGWALYSEFLGKELGLYTDPYMLYGHLSQEIFRACRLVVDTGIHALGWSRQRAIDYMIEYSAATQQNIANEIDRYITWPGQACSYKYGELKIKTLRKKAEDALGDSFDLKEFHDVILRNSGPLSFVDDQVRRMLFAAST